MMKLSSKKKIDNSYKDWVRKIEKDLKGKSIKPLQKETIEGIIIKPIYDKDKKCTYKIDINNSKKYLKNIINNNWLVNQEIKFDEDVSDFSKKIHNSQNEGLTAFTVKGNSNGYIPKILKKLPNILNCQIFFEKNNFGENQIKQLINFNKNIKGGLGLSPFSKFLKTGNYNEVEIEETIKLTAFTKEISTNMRTIKIDAYQKHMAGANLVEEVAFALAEGHEYLVALLENGITIDEVSKLLYFEFSVSTNFFLEIGKIKAFRILWSKIIEQYNPKKKKSITTFVHIKTSIWHHSILDLNNNMLRDTIASTAAAIAGADMITTNPYDYTVKKDNNKSKRWAKNTQILLKEESFINKIIDASSGTYVLENITTQFIKKCWKLFQKIETRGGFINAIKKGEIQDMIFNSYEKKIENIEAKNTIMVGVNKYFNKIEKTDFIKPLKKIKADKTTQIKSLKYKRASEIIEQKMVKI